MNTFSFLKKPAKRTVSFFLFLLFLFVSLFSGCSAKTGSHTTVSQIPADGIVRQAVFQQLKNSGGIAIYKGTSGGIAYSWTFIGTDIRHPADMNLRVSIKSGKLSGLETNRKVTFTLAQKKAFPGAASLSMTVGKSWGHVSLPLDTGNASSPKQAGTVRIVNGTATVYLSANTGPYFFAQGEKTSSASSESSSGLSSTASSSAVSGQSAVTSSSSKNSGSVSSRASSTAQASSSSQGGGAQASVETIHATLAIRCDTLNESAGRALLQKYGSDKISLVPSSGTILADTGADLPKGSTVYTLFTEICKAKRMQFDCTGGGSVGTAYVSEIANIKEFDAGPLSGWEYEVNGSYPDLGIAQYALKDGDTVQFNYTCDMGHDIGAVQ